MPGCAVRMHNLLRFLLRGRRLRPCLYGLGYPRQPSPLATHLFHKFFMKRLHEVGETTREASYLASAVRVTLACEATFFLINSLARL